MSTVTKQPRTILQRGTLLDDRFEIVELLGAGCFGAVYHARQLAFGQYFREVALKLFESEFMTSHNVHDVFNDAIAVIGLQEDIPLPEIASHIIQVYDIGVLKTQPPRPFLSMKLIRGGKTLQSLVRRYQADGMPVGTSLRFLKQILLPLAWMHTLETPMVHGDLKPDNILLTDSLDLIVTDFGLAARLPLGSMGGAIQYQAPETLLGVCAEAPADVYGLGLIWYEMLTGHHPFQDVGLEALAEDDSRAFIHAHQLARKWPIRPLGPQDDPLRPQRVRPASETNEELREHPQLEAILNRCLAYKQSDRYANAKVLLADLEQYSQTGKVPGLCSDIPKPPSDLELPGQTSDNLVADALSLIQQGRHLEAIAKAESALKLSAQSIPALLALVRARTGSRQLDKAKEIWQQSQQLAPHDPDVYQAGAELYQAMGKPGMAQSLREQAITARQRTGRR